MTPDPEAPPKTVKDMQWIYFLGTHNYAWIEDKNIKPYEEFKDKYKKKSTEAAMDEMDEIINSLANDPDYKIPFAKYISKRPSPKKVARKSSSGNKEDKKRSFPLKEKNIAVPKKKARTSSIHDKDQEHVLELSQDLLMENSTSAQKDITLNTVNLGTSQKFFGFLAGNVYSEGLIKVSTLYLAVKFLLIFKLVLEFNYIWASTVYME